jgi:succinate dehydrogenase / fumarate reductase iron-sulfur subunit
MFGLFNGEIIIYKKIRKFKMMKAGKIHWQDGIPFIDSMPKIKNLSELQKLIEISQTNKL